MFSRNRFNGQHGAGVSPKAGTKAKVHPPKKRSPNPRVALVIRGKIHRLLQGSADHHVPDSDLYYAGIEEEDECEKQEGRKEHRSLYQKVGPRPGTSPKVSNGKGHGVAAGPPCVGEVELNREGCIRIPCTLQHKSCRSPAHRKRISFEGESPTSPEQMRAAPYYSPVGPDMNGAKFAGAVGREFASPRVRPKRPYSAGDCLDYNFNRALPGTLLEEDEDGDKEEESSAIIEHILKELRGINKIQEEISDLRDYLTSVRGSVEEVSSCVDAVLLEIEGIRSSNKAGSGVHAGTWSGVGCKDGASPRRRPASAYGSLGSAMPKSDSKQFPEVCNERQRIHGELQRPRVKESTVCPTVDSVDHQELEEPEDASDHSSDIPSGAITRKLSFGYLERQDGQDCPSISSLSSHSSKSESDLEGPSSGHGRKQQIDDNGREHWTNAEPLHSTAGESAWHGEPTYLREGGLEDHEGESPFCCEGAGSWDHYRGGGSYNTLSSTGSSEHVSVRSRRHYNSPASTSSREEWQSWRKRPQTKSGIHTATDINLGNPAAGFECVPDCSYPKSSGYHSVEGHQSEEFDYGQSNDPGYTTDSQVDSYQETYLPYDESSAVTWTEASLCSSVADVDKLLSQRKEATYQNLDSQLPHPGRSDVQPGGFTVKRIGRAVLDFRSALRGALRKLEVPAAQNPGEETDFDISMLSDLPAAELPTKPLSYQPQFEQTCEENPQGDVLDTKNGSLDKSDLLFVGPVLEGTINSLTLESSDSGQHPPSSDGSQPCPVESQICPDTSSSSTAAPPPEGLREHPGEGPQDLPADVNIKTQLSQCTTTESLSASLLAEPPAEPADHREVEEPEQLPSDLAVSPDVKAEGDVPEPPPEISQMDERRLKCLRSFQQILREKRETRRNLTSVTMSSFSQEDLEPGSHDGIIISASSCDFISFQ